MKLRDGGIPINPGTDAPGATVRYEDADLRKPVVECPAPEELTTAATAALDKWGECAAERAAIEEFLGWAAGRMSWQSIMPMSDLLDQFYGIDRKNLEAGRQVLLAQAQRKEGDHAAE